MSNYQGRRPLDKKKKYIVGCQKSVTKPNAECPLSVRRTFGERSANVRRTLRWHTKAKSTVLHSSVEFAICRVFKGHYELPKNRWHIDVRPIWVGEKIFFRSTIFSKTYFFDQKKSKNRVEKKSSRSDLGSAEHFQRSRSDRYRARSAI